jgi:hypothetical protein
MCEGSTVIQQSSNTKSLVEQMVCLRRVIAITDAPPPPHPERSASASTWEGEKEKHAIQIFQRPDLRKNFRYPSKAPSAGVYTTGELRLWDPTTRITTHGSPFYAIQTYTGLHGFRGFVVEHIAAPRQISEVS